jgi:hypothetical protein
MNDPKTSLIISVITGLLCIIAMAIFMLQKVMG